MVVLTGFVVCLCACVCVGFVKYGCVYVLVLLCVGILVIRVLDIVGTVYHLVIYMQSNKIHKVF